VLIKVEAGAANGAVSREKTAKTESAPAAPVAAPVAASHGGGADIECDMLVLGAGPGGYSAAFRSADLGLKTVIVERYATLGGVCLNVGCIPSKALLHVAAVMEEAQHAADLGVTFAKPQVDIDKLRAHKDKVVGKLTGGLAGMAKGRKVEVVRGYGSFLDPHHIEVEVTDGSARTRPAPRKSSSSSSASSPPVRPPCICPSSRGPAHRRFDRRAGTALRAARRCWSSAAASSAWKWPPSIPRSAPASMSSK
jgi:dihydrolipoamide dehydrogenase